MEKLAQGVQNRQYLRNSWR